MKQMRENKYTHKPIDLDFKIYKKVVYQEKYSTDYVIRVKTSIVMDVLNI